MPESYAERLKQFRAQNHRQRQLLRLSNFQELLLTNFQFEAVLPYDWRPMLTPEGDFAIAKVQVDTHDLKLCFTYQGHWWDAEEGVYRMLGEQELECDPEDAELLDYDAWNGTARTVVELIDFPTL